MRQQGLRGEISDDPQDRVRGAFTLAETPGNETITTSAGKIDSTA
jgi:hypothetical protein